jgi:hypothetical protein
MPTPTDEPGLPGPDSFTISLRLPDHLIARAVHVGRDRRSDRAQRVDGWTPERIRTFLLVLARCGVVARAARAAGKSVQSAYALRRSAKGKAFDRAWQAALAAAAEPPIPDAFMSRALHGAITPIIRAGKVWGERHHFDNRHTMAVLTHLDKAAARLGVSDEEAALAGLVFEEFLDVACTGDMARVGAFIQSLRQPSVATNAASIDSNPPADAQPETDEWEVSGSSTLPAAPGLQPDEWQVSESSTLPGPQRDEWQVSNSSTSSAAPGSQPDEWHLSGSSTLPVGPQPEPDERQGPQPSTLPACEQSKSLTPANRFVAGASPQGARLAHAPPPLEEAA